MLAGTATIEETVIMLDTIYVAVVLVIKRIYVLTRNKRKQRAQVEWARNYVPRKSSAFDPVKVRR